LPIVLKKKSSNNNFSKVLEVQNDPYMLKQFGILLGAINRTQFYFIFDIALAEIFVSFAGFVRFQPLAFLGRI
jgi:hypothetical protein